MDMNHDDAVLLLAREGEAAALTPARERTIIRHLPYFVALAENGNFNRASESLGLSQSALTRRIQTLEKELGVLLFTRTTRSAKLTAAGQALFEDSGRILSDLRGATRRAQLVSRGEMGNIRVAINDHAIRSPIVIAAFRTLRERYHEMEIELHAMPSEAQLIALRRKEVDLGLLFDIVIDKMSERVMDHFSIQELPTYLALHASHPLAHKSAIFLADLRDQWLTWPSRRAGRSVSDRRIAAFHAAGVPLNISLEVMAEETTMNLAAANLGMGFVLETTHLPPDVTLRQIEDYKSGLNLHVVWLRDNLNPGVLKVVEELKREVTREAAPLAIAAE